MKSSLKFTTIALLLGGVLSMPCLNAAAADSLADGLEELQTSPILTKFTNTDEGIRSFVEFADKNANQKVTRIALRAEVCLPDSLPLAFFTSAAVNAKAGKSLIAFLIGVKTESLAGLKRTAELEGQLALATDSLAAERIPLKLTVSAPAAVVVTSEELPAYLALNSSKRTPKNPDALAEIVSIQAVRAALGTPGLQSTLDTLKTIETHLKHVVADAEGDGLVTAVARAHSFATLRNQLLEMAPKINEFLGSHTIALSDIAKEATKAGYVWNSVSFTPAHLLLNAEHRAGQNMALGAFDEIFQTGTPADVVVPLLASTKRSDTELVTALRTLLPRVVVPIVPAVISKDGLVLDIDSSGTTTEVLTGIRGKTKEFLSWAMGAKTVVGSSGLGGFETAELAKASLVPPPVVVPAVVIADTDVVASGGSSAVFVADDKTDAPPPPTSVVASTGGTTAPIAVAPSASTSDAVVTATAE